MPAIARNSVDLPEPDGPVTSTGSPRGILTLSDRHERRSVRQVHRDVVEFDRATIPGRLDVDHRRRMGRRLCRLPPPG